MPLHLLGKKSWNVYNQANVDKVKRDEAAAAARKAAEEQRMQEVDAERRIQLLRGIKPEAIPAPPTTTDQAVEQDQSLHKRERKRRRIAGEDDTARDIRYAMEDQAVVPAKTELQLKSTKSRDAPLMDHRGHIDLFPMEGLKHNAPKNAEVEAEKAKKKKELEDQYTMRFSNAAGFKQSIGEKPWYQSSGIIQDQTVHLPSKDVWGNEDPRRKEREKMRVAADDPMAMIQKGVSQLRQVEKERDEWRKERDRETRDLDRVLVLAQQLWIITTERPTNQVTDIIIAIDIEVGAAAAEKDLGDYIAITKDMEKWTS
ncbi:MAG: hypothetical protein L6R41_006790 [Letrouitia leprolyta]|nr:MAG: hypothetical protein L6R41_006790 [Letrouitia leprolyta]